MKNDYSKLSLERVKSNFTINVNESVFIYSLWNICEVITLYMTLIMIVRQNRIFAKFSDATIIIVTNSSSLRIGPVLNAILEGNQ